MSRRASPARHRLAGAADVLVRTARGIPEAALRASYMRKLLLDRDPGELAPVLDALCERAEQADLGAREALIPVVDALQDPACVDVVQRLREEAVGVPLLALERLVRKPQAPHAPCAARDLPSPEDDRVPDYGRGRPLTLGERKSLARRPDRVTLERLLRDPHPDVIRQVLASPKVTEDDVLSVAARRPCGPDVLAEIARSTRWSHRPRIRVALVLNPDTPLEIAAPNVGLLLRHELRLVVSSTTVAPAVRALCLEHLARRPPGEFDDDDAGSLQ